MHPLTTPMYDIILSTSSSFARGFPVARYLGTQLNPLSENLDPPPPDLLQFAATLYDSVASEATVTTVFMKQGRTVRGDFAPSPWSLQMIAHSVAAAAAG